MFNKLECVVLDLDKSLLSIDCKISEMDILTVKKLIHSGVYVFLATGRHYNVSKYYGYQLELKAPIICADGSMIYDIKKNTLIHCESLNYKYGELIWTWIQNNLQYRYNIYTDKRLIGNTKEFVDMYWFEAMNKDKLLLENSVVMDLEPVEIEDERIIKVVLYDWNEMVIKELIEMFKGCEGIEIVVDDKYTLEIQKSNVSKFTAVEFMSRHYGFSLKNTLALGDNQNDIQLLKGVGYPVTPSNAQPEYKKMAKFITSDCNSSPLTKCIESLFPQYI